MNNSADSLPVDQPAPAKRHIHRLAIWSLILSLAGPICFGVYFLFLWPPIEVFMYLPFTLFLYDIYKSPRSIDIFTFYMIIPLLVGLAAIITGAISIKQIRRSTYNMAGYGVSLAGIILGAVLSVLSLGIVLLWLFSRAIGLIN